MSFIPLVQMLMTVQFRPVLKHANILHLAGVVDLFKTRYPKFDQIGPAGPMIATFSQLEGSEPVEHDPAPYPRLQLSTETGDYVILFQGDRLSFGWVRSNRLADDPNYPGFEVMVDSLEEHLSRLTNFARSEIGTEIVPVVAELAYVNAFRLTDDDDQRRRLSSIFLFLSSANPISMRGWEFSWNETAEEDAILAIKAQGPTVLFDNTVAGLLHLTATFPTPAFSADQMRAAFTTHHDQISKSFRRIVHPDRLLRL